MFFIMGINPREKQLDFSQSIRCKRCGRYGRLEVFLTCMCFSLFFIPLFRWNKQYYARTTCCGGAALLPKELGERIAAGVHRSGQFVFFRGMRGTADLPALRLSGGRKLFLLPKLRAAALKTAERRLVCAR